MALDLQLNIPQRLELNKVGWYTQNPVPIVAVIQSLADEPLSVRWSISFEGNADFRVVDGRSLQSARTTSGRVELPPSTPTNVVLASIWIRPQAATTLMVRLTVSIEGGSAYQTTSMISIPQARVHPVLVLPGIMGSWPTAGRGVWELDPLLRSYDPLLTHLKDMGYVQGESLFPLPYDWREEPSVTFRKLKEQIDTAIQMTAPVWVDRSQVDIVAHSMGGLVAAVFIASEGSHLINRFVTMGTPWLGAPRAYLPFCGGDLSEYNPLERMFLRAVVFKWRRKTTAEDMCSYFSCHVPSMARLLPASNFGDYLFDKSTTSAKPFGQPLNSALDSLLRAVGPQLQTLAKTGKYLCLIGSVGPGLTPDGYRVGPPHPGSGKWKHGEVCDPPNDTIKQSEGDQTVPQASASMGNQLPVERFLDSEDYEGSAAHRQLPTRVQRRVGQFLAGLPTPAPFFTGADTNRTRLAKQFATKGIALFFKCPVDLAITNQDGKIVRFFPENRQWKVGIPAVVLDFGADEGHIVFLPKKPGRWQVDGISNGHGDFQFVALEFNGESERVIYERKGWVRHAGEVVSIGTLIVRNVDGPAQMVPARPRNSVSGSLGRTSGSIGTSRLDRLMPAASAARRVETPPGSGSVIRLTVVPRVGRQLPRSFEVKVHAVRAVAGSGTTEAPPIIVSARLVSRSSLGRCKGVYEITIPQGLGVIDQSGIKSMSPLVRIRGIGRN